MGDRIASSHFSLEVSLDDQNCIDDFEANINDTKITRYKWSPKMMECIANRINYEESNLFFVGMFYANKIGVEHMLNSNQIDKAVMLLQKWMGYVCKNLEIQKTSFSIKFKNNANGTMLNVSKNGRRSREI